jgi:hypothetical protein
MAKWVPMREAAAILKAEGFKISPNTISRLASRGTIQAKDDPVDARVRLVELDELRRLFTYRRSEVTEEDEDEE